MDSIITLLPKDLSQFEVDIVCFFWHIFILGLFVDLSQCRRFVWIGCSRKESEIIVQGVEVFLFLRRDRCSRVLHDGCSTSAVVICVIGFGKIFWVDFSDRFKAPHVEGFDAFLLPVFFLRGVSVGRCWSIGVCGVCGVCGGRAFISGVFVGVTTAGFGLGSFAECSSAAIIIWPLQRCGEGLPLLPEPRPPILRDRVNRMEVTVIKFVAPKICEGRLTEFDYRCFVFANLELAAHVDLHSFSSAVYN